jgi:hypothetical protein
MFRRFSCRSIDDRADIGRGQARLPITSSTMTPGRLTPLSFQRYTRASVFDKARVRW